MKPQPQRGHNADTNTYASVAGFLKLGVKNWEEAHEAEPAKISLPGEGREEPKAQSEPEQGAAAEGKEAGYEEGEEKEGGFVGALDAGPPDRESREAKAEVEAEAGAGGGEGGEKGGQEQRPGAAVEVWRAVDRRPLVSEHTFTLEQLWELEGVFHRTPYLDVDMRQELARRMGVTEDRILVWFKNRRANWKKCQRALRFRDAPPLLPAHPEVSNWGGPYGTIFIQEPNWVWVLLEPMPLELMPMLPMSPMPPMPPMPPMSPMPPMPPLLPMPPLPPPFLPPLPWIQAPSIHSGCPHMALPGPLPPVAFL